ncbi:MAG: gluconate 2-dehydrogenase subunit 3 family protein [Thermodesulfobacteriota bacterium]
MPLLYRRRTFLQLLAASGAATALPWLPGCSDRASGGAAARFFTPEERAVIEQLAAAVLPEGGTVGALGTDAVEYIDRWLAAFDDAPPAIYRGGPFSGRTPFPDPATGMPSDDFPDDAFLEILPPTRMQELSFRIELLGAASVANGNVNAALAASDPGAPLTGTWPGLRALYRQAVVDLNAYATAQGAPDFASLDDAQKLAAMSAVDARFADAFLANLAEGMFSAPEYGGNRDLAGWRDYAFDGDSQPLGHTLFDATTETLYDRPDQPNQTLDPARPNDGLEPEVESFVATITLAQGGMRFF